MHCLLAPQPFNQTNDTWSIRLLRNFIFCMQFTIKWFSVSYLIHLSKAIILEYEMHFSRWEVWCPKKKKKKNEQKQRQRKFRRVGHALTCKPLGFTCLMRFNRWSIGFDSHIVCKNGRRVKPTNTHICTQFISISYSSRTLLIVILHLNGNSSLQMDYVIWKIIFRENYNLLPLFICVVTPSNPFSKFAQK